MYVIFLVLSPYILAFAARRGWKLLLTLSSIIWILAQFGLRTGVHTLVVHVTRLQIPLQETGAFNLFAWQAIWLLGMWIGAESANPSPDGGIPFRKLPRYAYPVAAFVCLFFLGVRHYWLGPRLTQGNLGIKLDKWQLGPYRMVNLIAFSIVPLLVPQARQTPRPHRTIPHPRQGLARSLLRPHCLRLHRPGPSLWGVHPAQRHPRRRRSHLHLRWPLPRRSP